MGNINPNEKFVLIQTDCVDEEQESDSIIVPNDFVAVTSNRLKGAVTPIKDFNRGIHRIDLGSFGSVDGVMTKLDTAERGSESMHTGRD